MAQHQAKRQAITQAGIEVVHTQAAHGAHRRQPGEEARLHRLIRRGGERRVAQSEGARRPLCSLPRTLDLLGDGLSRREARHDLTRDQAPQQLERRLTVAFDERFGAVLDLSCCRCRAGGHTVEHVEARHPLDGKLCVVDLIKPRVGQPGSVDEEIVRRGGSRDVDQAAEAHAVTQVSGQLADGEVVLVEGRLLVRERDSEGAEVPIDIAHAAREEVAAELLHDSVA